MSYLDNDDYDLALFGEDFDDYIAQSELYQMTTEYGIPFDESYDFIFEKYLMHYGMPRRSGRYPWGSGDNPQRNRDFISYADSLLKKGFTVAQVAEAMNMSTTDYKALRAIASKQIYQSNINRARELKEHGYSNVKIGEIMGGVNESTVRGWLKPDAELKASKYENIAATLEEHLKNSKYGIDIGPGVNLEIGCTDSSMKTAIAMLEAKGYVYHKILVQQPNDPNKKTTVSVLADPSLTYSDIYNNRDKIGTITDYSKDGGLTFEKLLPPRSIDSSRVAVRYAEEGGVNKDGLIELRRGVADVSLGQSNYAQVRIAVDGTHYIKVMAVYSDNLPEGVDILFNTNKHVGTPMCGPKDNTVLKSMKDDPDNPFGALIKAGGQTHYIDADGKDQISCVNKIKEEGDWESYSKNLASQFLSKQPMQLINKQLNISYADKVSEYEDICGISNPTLRKKMMVEFAEECDKAAVTLKAAALPRQATKVLIPVPELKDNEVYCPSMRDGENVVLIRYPHAGRFELPECTVNNKSRKAQQVIGKDSIDAIGINMKVAQQLSGADFDGDTAIVIPVNANVKIATEKARKELINFDPKAAYPKVEGMKVLKESAKGNEMGRISNLITDMTLKGANPDEIVRAVKHSMVVIDAVKHELNYKLSEVENGIPELKRLYQSKEDSERFGGASTLISRAKSIAVVPERKQYNPNRDIDPETGEKIIRETGRTYTNKKGKIVTATEDSTKMAETKDAFTLSSGTLQETAYAKYANSLKSLANTARKASLSVVPNKVDPVAKETYVKEVASLTAKVQEALKNAPRERKAQLVASVKISAKEKANPAIKEDKDQRKKLRQQEINRAREKYGANSKYVRVQISDKEWEAINNNAVSSSILSQIFSKTDPDKLKERAMPRQTNTLSSAKLSKLKAMVSGGYTIQEAADAIGISVGTASNYLK